MQSPTDSPWLLKLIAENDAMQRCIVTWPNVYEKLGLVPNRVNKHDGFLVTAWATAARVRNEELLKMWDAMFDYGFVNQLGTSDPMACKFISTAMLGRMQKPQRPRGGA